MGDVERDRRGIQSRHELRLAVWAEEDLQCVRRSFKRCAEQMAKETATDDGAMPVFLEMERVGFGSFLGGEQVAQPGDGRRTPMPARAPHMHSAIPQPTSGLGRLPRVCVLVQCLRRMHDWQWICADDTHAIAPWQ